MRLSDLPFSVYVDDKDRVAIVSIDVRNDEWEIWGSVACGRGFQTRQLAEDCIKQNYPSFRRLVSNNP